LDSLTGHIQQNPRIARWANELDQRRAAVDLAKANAIPDVTVGVGVRNFQETNDNAAVAAVSIPLPLFNRNQGEIAKARFGVLKARMDEEAAKAEVRAELEEAYQRMAAAYQEAASLRDTVLPAAKRSYEAFENSYTQGKAEYLDVLDAQRQLLEFQLTVAQEQARLATRRAQLEMLSGSEINSYEQD
jgi:cobalt-zinc-cadmium efflux system outer membrane protein